MQKVGFIGLGTMGSGMVANLLKGGVVVYAYNRTPGRARDLAGDSLFRKDRPDSLPSKADIFFTSVSDDRAIKGVLFGRHGLMKTIKKGDLLVDCSTVSVDMTQRIGDECERLGAGFIDAPVTGSKRGADSGTLMFMIGGSKDHLDRAMPLLQLMGKRFVHCGDVTYGQRAKLALNLVQALTLESYYEGLILAVKNGVQLEKIMEILDNSGARSNISQSKMPAVLSGDFSAQFRLGLMEKDLLLARKEMRRLGLMLPLSEKIISIYKESAASGLSGEDFSATIKELEKKSGTNISKRPV